MSEKGGKNVKKSLRRILSTATIVFVMAGTMGVSAFAATYESGKIIKQVDHLVLRGQMHMHLQK